MEDDEEDTEQVSVAVSPKKAAAEETDESATTSSTEAQVEEEAAVPEMSEEEKKGTMKSEEFQSFVKRSSLAMERALSQASAYDILVDYSGGDDEVVDKEKDRVSQQVSTKTRFLRSSLSLLSLLTFISSFSSVCSLSDGTL